MSGNLPPKMVISSVILHQPLSICATHTALLEERCLILTGQGKDTSIAGML